MRKNLNTPAVNGQPHRQNGGPVNIERILPVSTGKWRDTFDAVSDGISIHDMNRNIVSANKALCRMLGKKEEELVGRKCYELLHGLPYHSRNCPLKKQSAAGHQEPAEFFEPFLGRWLAVSCVPCAGEEAGLTGIVHVVQDMTDRKNAEERLRAALKTSEEEKTKTEAIIAAIGDGISIQDRDFRIIYQNDVEKRIFGDRTGEHCYSVYEQGEVICEGCPVAMSFVDGNTHKTERSGSRGGERTCVELTTSPLRNAEGEIIAGIEVVRDVTDRKHTEEKLRQLNRLYTVLSEIDKMIIRVRDRRHLFEIACRIAVEHGLFRMAWIAMIDAEKEHLIPVASWGDDEGYVDVLKGLISAAGKEGPAMGKAVDSGQHFVCNDIENFGDPTAWRSEAIKRGYLSAGAFPVRMGGRVVGGIAFYSEKEEFFDDEEVGLLDELADDVSFALDAMEREEGRRKTQNLMGSILESVDEGFIIIDRQYRIITANRAYSEMVHMKIEEIIGRNCHSISHRSDKPCYELGKACPVKLTLETGEPCRTFHTHFDRKGNRLYLEIKSFPIRDSSGETVSVIETVNDVTETKNLEDQLRQAQKMEAVGRLAGGVAHDFNNILSAIMGYGNLLLMKVGTDAALRVNVEQILESADRAANLTRGLLAFGRKQILSPRLVDLNAVVMRVERLLLRLLGEDIEISTHLTKGKVTVMADSGQIEQVLMNLATNARDAMPNGGRLSISTEVAELGADFLRTRGQSEPGKYAILSFTDSGSGIDERTREKIFEPFFTTKKLGKGTGLGLAMVYGTIKQHKGFINVYSEHGKGTTFTVYLPAVQSDSVDIWGKSPAPAAGGKEKILVAEDDGALRKLYAAVLAELGYEVLTAEDGESAISVFRDNHDEISLVVLDVIMPRKNGGDVYREMRKIRPDIKTLFVSGYTADIIQKAGIAEDKGADIVHKPVSPRDLAAKLRGMLDR